jgi:hypothetical protein
METLVGLFGQPSPGEEYPYEGHPLRHVYWDSEGLWVVFSDYEFFRDDGLEHLAGWGLGLKPTGEPPTPGVSWSLNTAEGIGIGSTLADLQETYGDRVVLEAECDPGVPPTAAYVDLADADDQRAVIGFNFDRLPLDPTARIAIMQAGAGPGC